MTRDRRSFISLSAFMIASAFLPISARADESDDKALMDRFDYLSKNGNSNCSAEFAASIATMPGMTRLQGSCCSPMDVHRYVEQVKGLRKYAAVPEIPSDPYDIPAGLAQRLISHTDDALAPDEQRAYDYAMANSGEKGPCCCPCWRWQVFGGLAKYLIRGRGFTGEQIVEIWDLSDGCGGGAEHRHSWNQAGAGAPNRPGLAALRNERNLGYSVQSVSAKLRGAVS